MNRVNQIQTKKRRQAVRYMLLCKDERIYCYYSLRLIAVSVFLLALTFASAQDQALYAPAPPANAAFVRVVHAAQDAGNLEPAVGTVGFGALSYGDASPYQVVTEGQQTFTAGEQTGEVTLEAGHFYTVIVQDAVSLLQDPTLGNRAKTLVVLYNLTAEPTNLKTADGATDVIPDVAPGELGSIEVNPISVAFGAFSGSEALTALDEVQLERGAVYSVLALPDGTVALSQNTTATD